MTSRSPLARLRLPLFIALVFAWPFLELPAAGQVLIEFFWPALLLCGAGFLGALAAKGGGAARAGLRRIVGAEDDPDVLVTGAEFLSVAGRLVLQAGLLIGLLGALLLFARLGFDAEHDFRAPQAMASSASLALLYPLLGVLLGRVVLEGTAAAARGEAGRSGGRESDLVPLVACIIPPVVFLGITNVL